MEEESELVTGSTLTLHYHIDDKSSEETCNLPNPITIDDIQQDDEIQIVSFSLGGKAVSPKEFEEGSKTTMVEGAATSSSTPVPEDSKYPGLPDEILPFVKGQQKRSQDCDVLLMSGNAKEVVHESVLSSYSPFLKNALQERPKKNKSAAESQRFFTLKIDIPDSTALKLLVKNMYNGGKAVTLDEAKKLLPATTVLEIDYLSKICIKIITNSMDSSNCLDVVLLAGQSKNKKLRKVAETMIMDKLDTVLKSSAFRDLSLDKMIQLISKDTLTFSSEIINNIIDSWLSHNERQSNASIPIQLKTIQMFRGQDKYKPNDFKLESSEEYIPGWEFLKSMTLKETEVSVSPISTKSKNVNKVGESIKMKLLEPESLPKSSDRVLESRRKRKIFSQSVEPDEKKSVQEISVDTMQQIYSPRKSVLDLPRIPKRQRRDGVIEMPKDDSWDTNESSGGKGGLKKRYAFDTSPLGGQRGRGRGGLGNNNRGRRSESSARNIVTPGTENWDSEPVVPSLMSLSVSAPKTTEQDDWDAEGKPISKVSSSSWDNFESTEKSSNNSWDTGNKSSSFGNGSRGRGNGRGFQSNNNNRGGGRSSGSRNVTENETENWESEAVSKEVSNVGQPSVSCVPKTTEADDWDSAPTTTTSNVSSQSNNNLWSDGNESFDNNGSRGGGSDNNNKYSGGSFGGNSINTFEDEWATPSTVPSTQKTNNDEWDSAAPTISSWEDSQLGENSTNNSWGNGSRSFGNSSRGGSRGGRSGGRGGRGGGDSSSFSQEGVWKCSGCGFPTNYASKSVCHKCGVPKPGGNSSTKDGGDWGGSGGNRPFNNGQRGGRGGSRGGRNSSNLEGTWACSSCDFVTNYASRTDCFRCKTPKPGGNDGGSTKNDDQWGNTSTGSSWGDSGSRGNKSFSNNGRGQSGSWDNDKFGGSDNNSSTVPEKLEDWDTPSTNPTPVASTPKTTIIEENDWDTPGDTSSKDPISANNKDGWESESYTTPPFSGEYQSKNISNSSAAAGEDNCDESSIKKSTDDEGTEIVHSPGIVQDSNNDSKTSKSIEMETEEEIPWVIDTGKLTDTEEKAVEVEEISEPTEIVEETRKVAEIEKNPKTIIVEEKEVSKPIEDDW